MQTFLPAIGFHSSAILLDNKRLGKQRVEAWQILNSLLKGPGAGWYNHPATQMWKGYERALAAYGCAVCRTWTQKGFKDGLFLRFSDYCGSESYENPPWFGDKDFHASHRSNLMRKDPAFYGQYGWGEPADLPYVWPTQKGGAE